MKNELKTAENVSPEKKPDQSARPYDERQKLVRYKCFTHAYIMMPLLLWINLALTEDSGTGGLAWFPWWEGCLLCVVFSFVLAMIEAVARDAYYPPRAKDSLLWCAIDTLFMLACGGMWYYKMLRDCALRGDMLIENGVLHEWFLYPVTFLLLAAVPIAAFIKVLINRRSLRRGTEDAED